jgi:probable selenium-dependent hydroxylase accessory protein YqeC
MVERQVQWHRQMKSLWEALGLRRGACLAFIGAGGKTTTMLALAHEAMERGLTVMVTTTTKIWPPVDMPLVLEQDSEKIAEACRPMLLSRRCVAVGQELTDRGKVAGLDPSTICRLVESTVADVVLCEADGAAGRPLKVHDKHEPVVPSCSTSVAIVAGLDSLGRMPGPNVIHRFQQYLDVMRWDPPAPISPAMCADLLVLAANRLQNDMPVAYVLNKADDASLRRTSAEVAAEIGARVASTTVVITSHLRHSERTTSGPDTAGREQKAHAAT